MIWYFVDWQRRRRERRAIEELLDSVDWLSSTEGWKIGDKACLTWEGNITVGDRVYPVTLHFPQHFPHSPVLVLPRGDKSRWSNHQWGAGGELCLEYGSDNWHPDVTGADMLQSAFRLLQGEASNNEGVRRTVASRHDVTIGQKLRADFFYFLETREFTEATRSIEVGDMLSANAVTLLRTESYIYIVSEFTRADGEKWKDPRLPAPLKLEGLDRTAAIFRLPEGTHLPSSSLTEFRSAVERAGMTLPDMHCAFVLNGTAVRAYYFNAKDDAVTELALIPAPKSQDRLDAAHAALDDRRIVIIGCGSIGSKIAAMLARAGVKKFLLIDDDILFPDNFVRHDLDWREVGTHKAYAVARRIKLINADAVVSVRCHKLGGQEPGSSVETLIKEISDCDLMIDATADPKVFNYLCASSARGKKPFIWAEVFAGGVGGLVARHRPEHEPPPASMRRIIEAWCEDRNLPPQRPAGRYEDGDESHPPMIADDADVTVIAAHAARMAIDTLIPRSPSSFPHAVYMIGLSKGLFFSQPFETLPIEVGGPEDAGELIEDENLKAEESEHLKTLIQKFADENSSDS